VTKTKAKSRSIQKKQSGLLITFEGTEGAGKSTLIRNLKTQIEAASHPFFRGREVVLTREPGGSPVAEAIRSVILGHAMDPWAELFLYEAARAEHLATTLLPALKRGAIILCDRFTDSTLAYQSHARGLSWSTVSTLNDIATQGLQPFLTFHLDLDPALGLARAREQTRFEAEGVRFQTRVRQGFLKSKRLDPNRWIRLNAEKLDAETLSRKAFEKLVQHLDAKKEHRKSKPLRPSDAKRINSQISRRKTKV